jgi:hypothetical protein
VQKYLISILERKTRLALNVVTLKTKNCMSPVAGDEKVVLFETFMAILHSTTVEGR